MALGQNEDLIPIVNSGFDLCPDLMIEFNRVQFVHNQTYLFCIQYIFPKLMSFAMELQGADMPLHDITLLYMDDAST